MILSSIPKGYHAPSKWRFIFGRVPKAREAAVSDVRLEVIGTLSDAPPTRFSRLELRVTADTPDIGLLEKLTEIADRGCIMMNTLRDTLDLSVSAEIATR